MSVICFVLRAFLCCLFLLVWSWNDGALKDSPHTSVSSYNSTVDAAPFRRCLAASDEHIDSSCNTGQYEAENPIERDVIVV